MFRPIEDSWVVAAPTLRQSTGQFGTRIRATRQAVSRAMVDGGRRFLGAVTLGAMTLGVMTAWCVNREKQIVDMDRQD